MEFQTKTKQPLQPWIKCQLHKVIASTRYLENSNYNHWIKIVIRLVFHPQNESNTTTEHGTVSALLFQIKQLLGLKKLLFRRKPGTFEDLKSPYKVTLFYKSDPIDSSSTAWLATPTSWFGRGVFGLQHVPSGYLINKLRSESCQSLIGLTWWIVRNPTLYTLPSPLPFSLPLLPTDKLSPPVHIKWLDSLSSSVTYAHVYHQRGCRMTWTFGSNRVRFLAQSWGVPFSHVQRWLRIPFAVNSCLVFLLSG